MKIKNFFRRADIIIIMLVLLCAGLFYLINRGSQSTTAQIIIDGTLYETIDFSQAVSPYTKELGNGITLLIEKDGVSVISSDCYGKNCVNCKKLTRSGDTAVCIPNKTVIKVSGTNKAAPDAMTY